MISTNAGAGSKVKMRTSSASVWANKVKSPMLPPRRAAAAVWNANTVLDVRAVGENVVVKMQRFRLVLLGNRESLGRRNSGRSGAPWGTLAEVSCGFDEGCALICRGTSGAPLRKVSMSAAMASRVVDS